MMSYEPLHHKYRPQIFADLVGQEAIATTLTNAINQERIAPAYLFTGPRGTGKTSSARILAKSLNCIASPKPTAKPCGQCNVCREIAEGITLDVIEIDAASNTGVDNMREIIERAQFAPVQCRYKVYVIDECHMLSTAAFNALLKTLEEPPLQVVFVLATTDPQRVLPTIISRCQRFDFRRIPLQAMVTHLQKIASLETINIIPEAVQLVAQVAQGGLRDAESLLDQLSLLPGQVTVERVWDLIGSVTEPDLLELLRAIAQNNPEAILDCTRTILDRGREPIIVLQNLASFYRDLLIAKTAPNRSDLVAVTQPTWTVLCEEAKNWEINTILKGQQHLKESEIQIKNTTQPRLWLEMTILGLLPSAQSQQPPVSIKRPSEKPPSNSQVSQPSLPPKEPTQTPPSHKDTPLKETATTNSGPSPQASLPELTPITNTPPEPRPGSPNGTHTTASAQVSSEASSASERNESVWQQVLGNLQPMSTRALLGQMGRLLEFDGTTARIGLKSQAWYKKAQVYLPNIIAAFQETFHREVLINLELATPNQEQKAVINEPSPTPKTAPASPPPRVEPQKNISTTSADNLATSVQQESSMPTPPPPPEVNKDKESGESESVAQNNGQSFAPETNPHNPLTLDSSEVDEVAIAAQHLADFFKGEVVMLNLDPNFPQPLPPPAKNAEDANLFVPETEEEEPF